MGNIKLIWGHWVRRPTATQPHLYLVHASPDEDRQSCSNCSYINRLRLGSETCHLHLLLGSRSAYRTYCSLGTAVSPASMGFTIWRRVPGRGLRILLQVFSAVALIFEGYNQGVMGTVSGTPGFIDMAQIGANGKVTNSTKQGYVVCTRQPPSDHPSCVTLLLYRNARLTRQQRSRGCVLLWSYVGMLHRWLVR